MLRNCLIYRPVGELKEIDDIDLSYTIMDCADKASGQLHSRLSLLTNKIVNEELTLNNQFDDHIEFIASLTVEAPRVAALGDSPPPMIDVTFPIWVFKSQSFVLFLDAGRKLAFPISAMLSMALFNKPNKILPIHVTLEDYLSLIN